MSIDVAGKLFPNIATIIIQLCATGVMFMVFKKYLWNTVKAFMEKRAEIIEGNILEAKQINEKAKVFIEESENQAKAAAKEYREIIEKAKDEALMVKEGILEEANKEAKAKLVQADRQIEAQKLAAKEEMKQEIVEVALEVATKVMEKEIDYETNQKFADEFIKDIVN